MTLIFTLGGILLISNCITGGFLYKKSREKFFLQKTKSLYESVFKSINAFIILIDEDFFVKMVNYQTDQTFAPKQPTRVGEFLLCKNGIDSGECGKHEWCKKCPVRRAVTQTFRSDQEFTELEIPMRVYKDEGKTQYVDAYFSISGKIFKLNGKKHTLLTLYNVTPQKNKQYSILQEKKQVEQFDQLKSVFLMNLCRELKLPMTSVTGLPGIQFNSSTEDKAPGLKDFIGNQDTLQQLIGQVSDLSNIETGATKFIYTPVNLNDLLIRLGKNCRIHPSLSNEVEVRFKPEMKKCEIITDADRLFQLLDNLLHNAIHVTLKGEITVGYTIREEDIYFYVQDNGPHIPSEEQTQIFNRFTKFRTNKPDVGLRLSVSKVITEKLQGEIGMYSNPKAGSTFWFTLPVKPL